MPEKNIQHIVTQAMLFNNLALDEILYVVLSSLTHVQGLSFSRAFLFLADEDGRELRAFTAVGPSSQEEAQRLQEEQARETLTIETCLARYKASFTDHRNHSLAKQLIGFGVPLSATAPSFPRDEENVPIQAIVARAAAFKEPFLSNSLQAIYAPPTASGGELLQFNRLACVPLVARDVIVGILLVDNAYQKLPIEDAVMQQLLIVANLTALAIDNQRLQRRIKELGALDGLTGVFNRHYFDLRLEQEIALAQRSGRSLTLILFDIDNFKDFNQTKGHQKGDLVLRSLADLLKERVRGEDPVARYSGEQFVVLLTGGATREESFQVAEKLRSQIAHWDFAGLPAGEITVSVGVSTNASVDSKGMTLAKAAQEALRQAKAKGRNQVVLLGQ